MTFQGLDSTIARREYEASRPARAVTADDVRAQILERRLLLAFIVVAAISMLWHLGTGLQWLWANCITQLHSALTPAGIF